MPMMKQVRILFDTDDILQLRLVCNYRDEEEKPCGGEVLYQFGVQKTPRDWQCPKCGNEWKTTFPPTMPPAMREVGDQEAATFDLVYALETLVKPGCGPFGVRFEVDAATEKDG